MAGSADARRVTIGLVFTVLAMLSFVTVGLLANHLVDRGNLPVVVASYEALFGLAFTLGIRARRLRSGGSPVGSGLGWMLGAGVLFAMATGSFYTALARVDYSVAAPIVGAVPLVSYVFVLLLLRGYERLTPRVVFGAMLVVAGVGIIGAAN
ncbi:MAG: EamA family transporter [Chloroflexota bacterium]|nr:EamA family transporter [Chloroflexota bacterium]MDE2884286.1 EamA family transporter [Chloroflexota bacterium]